jgi:hypothetical protein
MTYQNDRAAYKKNEAGYIGDYVDFSVKHPSDDTRGYWVRALRF